MNGSAPRQWRFVFNGDNSKPRLWRLETAVTRDEIVPANDDDRDMRHSYRSLEIPPANDSDWFIVDDSHDRRTTWGRWV